MQELPPRQRQVLDYVAASIQQRGIAPSLREISDMLGASSTNSASDHVKALVRKGYLARVEGRPGRARALRLARRYTRSFRRNAMVAVPILGRVVAGMPVLSDENYEGTIHVDASLLPGGAQVFALRVRGDSMIEDGILDGDQILVRHQPTARNGQVVVALVDGEATVKRFFRERGRIVLQPANSQMAPILVHPQSDVRIVGVVVGLYRRLR